MRYLDVCAGISAGGAIVLPWPPRELSPNGRAHWATKAQLTKIARQYAFMAAKEAKLGVSAGDVPILVSWTFHPKTKNAVDLDNLAASCKAYQDGIASAMKVDDSWFRPTYTLADPVKGGKVVVVVQ